MTLEHSVERRQVERAAHAARMLERIVHARHLAELDRSVEIPVEPQLLEVRDVAEVPDDGAHQRIVLLAKLVVATAAR